MNGSSLRLLGCLLLVVSCTTTSPANREAESQHERGDRDTSQQASREVNRELIAESVAPPRVEWTDEVDFGELRELYGRRRDFSLRCERSPERSEAGKAVDAGDAARTIELTESLLMRCPVDPILHHWRYSALISMGLEAEAEIQKRWVIGLFDSILATGDGKTMDTPFVTISINEEYALLAYLGLTPRRQSLVDGPRALDAILAEAEDGSKEIVYFSPVLHFVRLLSAFESGP